MNTYKVYTFGQTSVHEIKADDFRSDKDYITFWVNSGDGQEVVEDVATFARSCFVCAIKEEESK